MERKNVKYNSACIDLYKHARDFSTIARDTILTNYGRLFQTDFHDYMRDLTPAELIDDLAMIMYEMEADLESLKDEDSRKDT